MNDFDDASRALWEKLLAAGSAALTPEREAEIRARPWGCGEYDVRALLAALDDARANLAALERMVVKANAAADHFRFTSENWHRQRQAARADRAAAENERDEARAKLAAARKEIEERKLLCESAAKFLAAASVHAGQRPTSDAEAAAPVAAPSGQGSCYAGENPAAANPAAAEKRAAKCDWCGGSGEVGPPDDRYVCPCPTGRAREAAANPAATDAPSYWRSRALAAEEELALCEGQNDKLEAIAEAEQARAIAAEVKLSAQEDVEGPAREVYEKLGAFQIDYDDGGTAGRPWALRPFGRGYYVGAATLAAALKAAAKEE